MSLEVMAISRIFAKYLNRDMSKDEQRQLDIWLAQDEIHQSYFKQFIENRKVVEYLQEYSELLDTQNTQLSAKNPIWAKNRSSYVIDGFDIVLLSQVLKTLGYCFIMNLKTVGNHFFVLNKSVSPNMHERPRRALLLLKERIFSEINRD